MLGKLFSGGAADLVKGVGGVIDNLHTSGEEKLEAERKIKEIFINYRLSEIRTPILEDIRLFSRSVGSSSDIVNKEIYEFVEIKNNQYALSFNDIELETLFKIPSSNYKVNYQFHWSNRFLNNLLDN